MRSVPPALIAMIMLVTSVARADIESGPNVGTAVTALKVFAATGEHAGKELDFAADRGAKPTVYVFIPYDRFDRPLARLLKTLEKSVIEAGNEATVVTVFLADDEAAAKDRLPKANPAALNRRLIRVFPTRGNGCVTWRSPADSDR